MRFQKYNSLNEKYEEKREFLCERLHVAVRTVCPASSAHVYFYVDCVGSVYVAFYVYM